MTLWARKFLKSLLYFAMGTILLRVSWGEKGFWAELLYVVATALLIGNFLFLTALMGVSEKQLQDREKQRRN